MIYLTDQQGSSFSHVGCCQVQDILTKLPQEALVDNFRHELLHTRNEYVKFYEMYKAKLEAKCKLEIEYKELFENKEENVKNQKALKNENKALKEKLENASLELRHFKTDFSKESLQKKEI